MQDPRYIKSDLKTKLLNPEKEKPSRWSFLKVLREYSTLKQFYPEINPYAEVYKFREDVYCIFYDGIRTAEMWCYLIDGPEKALVIHMLMWIIFQVIVILIKCIVIMQIKRRFRNTKNLKIHWISFWMRTMNLVIHGLIKRICHLIRLMKLLEWKIIICLI